MYTLETTILNIGAYTQVLAEKKLLLSFLGF
jgi:hypothetical protein